MPHVITQACCADASCVYACPVNCIHPTPDEADFATAEMLYIDPLSCVDCRACVSACPVGAIKRDTRLSPEEQPFLDINAAFYSTPREYPPQARLERALGNNSGRIDRKSTRLNSSHVSISYAVSCLKKTITTT